MSEELKIYRWKGSKWERIFREGPDRQRVRTSPEYGSVLNFYAGLTEGDWLLHNGRTNAFTILRAAEVPPTGTIWRWSGRRWHHLYRRTSGNAEVPPELDGIAEEGASIIDMRDPSRSGPGELRDGDFKFILPNGDLEDVFVEVALEPDEDALAMMNVKVTPEDVRDVVEKAPLTFEEKRDLEAIERAALLTHRIKLAMQEPGMMAEWADIQRGDAPPEKVAKFCLKLYDEATPSPTPGTTAPFDLTLMINDFERAAKGFDDQGQFQESGFLSEDTATVFGSTSSLLAGLGSSLNYFKQLKTICDSIDQTGTATGRRQAGGAANTAAMTGLVDAPKAVNNLFGAVNTVTQVVDKTSSFASAAATVAQGIPFVGVIISLVTYTRTLRKGGNAWLRFAACKDMLKKDHIHTKEMKEILQFAVGKTKRKMYVCGATAGTAAVSSLSSTILATTAIVGGANAWNPVGWTLLGLAAVGGVGVVGYKVYRRATRERRHVERALKAAPMNAADMARRLLAIARNDQHSDRNLARMVLELFNVDVADIHGAIDDTVEAMISRHMQHV